VLQVRNEGRGNVAQLSGLWNGGDEGGYPRHAQPELNKQGQLTGKPLCVMI
jgi:hypothetical protein